MRIIFLKFHLKLVPLDSLVAKFLHKTCTKNTETERLSALKDALLYIIILTLTIQKNHSLKLQKIIYFALYSCRKQIDKSVKNVKLCNFYKK